MLNRLSKKLLLSFAIAPVFVSQPVLAHVVWFEPINQNKFEVVFGHPEIPEIQPANPDKLKEVTAYDAQKNILETETQSSSDRLFIRTTETPAALTAFYDNGFYLVSNGQYNSISQAEAEAIGFENVSNFVKYAKSLYTWSDQISGSFGLPLEIIALENPFEIEAGESLPIQVLFNGSVSFNSLIEYLGEEVAVDNNGIALIPIGTEGLQVIEASFTDPQSINPSVEYAATFAAQEAVPEPLTLLGVGTALGFGTFFKRQLHKKSKHL